MAEFKGKTKHRTTGKKGQTDFYVVLDYKKMRGVKFCKILFEEIRILFVELPHTIDASFV